MNNVGMVVNKSLNATGNFAKEAMIFIHVQIAGKKGCVLRMDLIKDT
jgi:hypothetical protein